MGGSLLSQQRSCITLRSTLILATAFILQLQIISNDAFSVAINSIQKHHDAELSKNGLCLHLFRSRRTKFHVEEENKAKESPAEVLHTFPRDYNDTFIDEYFMAAALRQAQLAWKKDEVPIGAVIVQQTNKPDNTTDSTEQVRTFRVISEAHNLVETNIDASAHAELMALRQGAQNLQNWRYPPNCTLYSTLEPCPMCLASAQAFRIDNIVFGAYDNRLGAIQTHMHLLDVAKHPYHDIKSVTGCVKSEECANIMVEFFRERRRIKKERDQQSLIVESEDDHLPRRRKRIQFGKIMSAILKMFESQ